SWEHCIPPCWCPLSPAGAQTPQLLVEPPWTPAVLWDRVTLTCQGSGTAGATTWYKDGRAWGQEGPDIFTVTRSGTYQCQRPGTGLSPPVTVSDGERDWLVLQVPARALLEGDTVTLRCRVWQNNPVTSVSFYRDGKELGTLQNGTELSLSPLQRNHSGHYHCRGWLGFLGRWEQSEPVAVTVQGEHPTATTPTPPLPLPRHSGSQIPLPHLLPRGTTGHLWNTGGVTRGSRVGLRPPDHR
uniref:Ig-like domain-containing protein n=1 Tax=Catharus ustulatus TaxID=91951 RepID=A0A8C3UIR7_CATUS